MTGGGALWSHRPLSFVMTFITCPRVPGLLPPHFSHNYFQPYICGSGRRPEDEASTQPPRPKAREEAWYLISHNYLPCQMTKCEWASHQFMANEFLSLYQCQDS